MDLFEFLDHKLRIAVHNIEALLNHFDSQETIDREGLIQKGGAAFDLIISYIRIEDNLIFPALRKKGLLQQEIAAIKAIQQEIENIIESSVMMHVDEPSCEFRDNLKALLKQLIRYRNIDQQQIFPYAKNAFSTNEMRALLKNVQEQMSHEGHAEQILQAPPY